jgi:hypothetical protein
MVAFVVAGLIAISPLQAPRLGQNAPDVAFEALDSSKQFRISDSRGKRPLVLIFGSCT